jgi:hypothetical protein
MSDESYVKSQTKHIEAMLNIAQRLKDLEQDNERLQAENDKLRAELLKAPNAQMVAFIADFEAWLYREIPDGIADGYIHYNWQQLKAQHGLSIEDGE